MSVVYIETWQGQNQATIDGGKDISKAISSFNDYTSRKLFKIDKDTTQLLTYEMPQNPYSNGKPDFRFILKWGRILGRRSRNVGS